MLKYTGHPLVDVGVAVITAFAGKSDPAEVTADDLNKIAAYIEREYSKNPMKSFLTVIYVNSDFTQAAFDNKPERKKVYAARVLQAWNSQHDSLDAKCTFFDAPAVELADSKMLALSSNHCC